MRSVVAVVVAGLCGSCAASDGVSVMAVEAIQDAAGSKPTSRWPVDDDGTVYYHVDLNGDLARSEHASQCEHAQPVPLPGDMMGDPPEITAAIKLALDTYKAQTPLQFVEVPLDYTGHPVMVFTVGDFGTAHSGGAPEANSESDYIGCVYFTPTNVPSLRTILHEIGHDLGFIHEQQRSDRNDFVIVHPGAIVDSGEDYEKIDDSDNLAPYDIHSVMQYRSKLVGGGYYNLLLKSCASPSNCCGLNDPDCRCPASEPNCRIVEPTDGLSPHDRNALYRMYETPLGTSEEGDDYGHALAAGDFDGDGYDDLAVGAPTDVPVSGPTIGAVYLYKGTERGLVSWRVLSERDLTWIVDDNDKFGTALLARDLDGDGADELLVGAPGYKEGTHDGAGAVFLYKGSIESGPQPLARYGQGGLSSLTPNDGDHFGQALLVSKLNGTDLKVVVGMPGKHTSNLRTGAAVVLNIGSGITLTYSQFIHPGQFTNAVLHDGDLFGSAFAAADWNDDGVNDLAVGAPQTNVALVGGLVYLYAGGTSLSASTRVVHSSANSEFGSALAVGRFRGETWPSGRVKKRLAIGAPGHASAAGAVFVYNPTSSGGPAMGTSPQVLDQGMTGLGMNAQAGDRFGAVLLAINLDGDSANLDDLLVASPNEGVSGDAGAGAVAFFHGQSGAPLAGWGHSITALTLQPNRAQHHYGAALAAGLFGDKNDDPKIANDEFLDVAIARPGSRTLFLGPAAGAFEQLLGDGGIPTLTKEFIQETASRE